MSFGADPPKPAHFRVFSGGTHHTRGTARELHGIEGEGVLEQ
jgi:hypothetical protein